MTFSISSVMTISIYVLNLLFALIVIFVSRKTASSTWAWLFVLLFLHAKMMVIDDEIVTIDTTNIDVRSFSLNFEINAILFDENFAMKCRQVFEQDLRDSFEMTPELFAQRPLWTKIRESFSRLLSPIL